MPPTPLRTMVRLTAGLNRATNHRRANVGHLQIAWSRTFDRLAPLIPEPSHRSLHRFTLSLTQGHHPKETVALFN